MTINYYQHNADSFFTATVAVDMSSLYAPFVEALTPPELILDAGCGSGRDAKAFAEMGYQVEAFDASSEMVARAARYSGLPVRQRSFTDISETARYDGIWCCASLLHVPGDELPGVMQRLATALKPGGVWYVSFKYGTGEREKEGRRFTDLDEAGLAALVAALVDIDITRMWQTLDKRPDRSETWLNALLLKA
ncbi:MULTISPECIES: bifunctional 2-polyprenyl-6-hydroxyphenol methylase/3-demethylubiquinol 3-O-methyltransferase UbiG [Raoultella]|uniref:class I SAM-dependent methyltransferase n=1 Tax=Raoultella TaxID=160674 RepID=UPI002168C3A8|nr:MULTISPECIES: class I SAM-dependent methyltransferase [Raoultella]MCS4272466.1 2-polyprenyl-3-methyl-5-hydroxy-6-metoxy-1,4-benzoquinol methylase [Raoultella sp. BIGb0132]MCS4289197.1 2-polyprenyl-3-methyl-5-hydroxy-6-metoxy-1,4-benzoquinol methylase [Raoultella terrigena]